MIQTKKHRCRIVIVVIIAILLVFFVGDNIFSMIDHQNTLDKERYSPRKVQSIPRQSPIKVQPIVIQERQSPRKVQPIVIQERQSPRKVQPIVIQERQSPRKVQPIVIQQRQSPRKVQPIVIQQRQSPRKVQPIVIQERQSPRKVQPIQSGKVQTYPKCKGRLPYQYHNFIESEYYKWIGVKGTSLQRMQFEPGHLFERHIAIDGRCTAQQIKEGKTVFLDIREMSKAMDASSLMCTNPSEFTFSETINALNIRGFDCKKYKKFNDLQLPEYFSSVFLQYKKAVRERTGSAQYLKSPYTTIWTIYPKR